MAIAIKIKSVMYSISRLGMSETESAPMKENIKAENMVGSISFQMIFIFLR